MMNTTLANTDKHNTSANSPESTYESTFVPRFDIWEGDDELRLYGDLPGVTPENLDIQFENRELTIHGKAAPRQDGVEYLYGEYGIGDFHRTFTIGEAIDVEKISAEMRDGVLTLHLPKSENVKPRRIEVKTS